MKRDKIIGDTSEGTAPSSELNSPPLAGAAEMNGCDAALSGSESETALTGDCVVVNGDSDDNGIAYMAADDPRLEQAFSLIRAVIADADKRAADDLVARISGNRPSSAPANRPPDRRAPKGSAANLIDRALAEVGDEGLTVLGIHAKAEGTFEKMVTASAIRNWLKEGLRKRPPLYRQVGGVWFLAGRGPAVRAVS